MKKLLLALTLSMGFALPTAAQEPGSCEGAAVARIAPSSDSRPSFDMRLWNEDDSRAMDLRIRFNAEGRAYARVRTSRGFTRAFGTWEADERGMLGFRFAMRDGGEFWIELTPGDGGLLRGCWGSVIEPPVED